MRSTLPHLLPLLLPLQLLAACAPPPPAPPGKLDVFPQKAFTGVEVNAEEGFTVPAIQHVQGVTTVWESSDDTKLVMHDQGNGLVVMESKGAGDVTVKVTAEGREPFELPVVILEYPEGSSHGANELYYNTYRCAECHDGQDQSDITSSGIAEHTDAETLAAIVDGVNPEDGQEIDSPDHRYALDEAQQVIMMAFLRWQSSKTFPSHDH